MGNGNVGEVSRLLLWVSKEKVFFLGGFEVIYMKFREVSGKMKSKFVNRSADIDSGYMLL